MKSIGLQIENLERFLHNLIHLGEGDIYVNLEEVIRLNKEIRTGIEVLYPEKGSNAEEEAALCSVLLRAYGSLIYHEGKDELRRQTLVERSVRLIEELPSSLLKCRLLVYCFGEIYDPEFVREAHAIMSDWQGRKLTFNEQELVDTLRILEDTLSSL